MSFLHWLMPWRRTPRPAKPFRAVAEVQTAIARAEDHDAAAQRSVRVSVDAIQRQQFSGLRSRLIQRADDLRALTNDAVDRTRGR